MAFSLSSFSRNQSMIAEALSPSQSVLGSLRNAPPHKEEEGRGGERRGEEGRRVRSVARQTGGGGLAALRDEPKNGCEGD